MKDSRLLHYGDITFSCIHKERRREVFPLNDHTIVYLYSGKLEVHGAGRQLYLSPGEGAFIRKDCRISMVASMAGPDEPYKAVTITLSRKFLLDYYRRSKTEIPSSAVRSEEPVLRIPARPDVAGLFESLMPFFRSGTAPDAEWMEMKKNEALRCLLKTDQDVYASLFDFTSRWKIDLVGFMEENYMQDLSLSDFANFTGRSIAGFNRDFRKAFGVTPQKWIIDKRLRLARQILWDKGCSVTEAMYESGFSNISYFSRVYKQAFGHSPSSEKRPGYILDVPLDESRVLLHSCCAPCSGAIIECLLQNGVRPTVFFSNSNIYPHEEYLKRKEEISRFALAQGLEIVDDDYDHEEWREHVRGLEKEPERGARCLECFRFRLLRAARYASRNGYRVLTTTLASSRWKDLAQVSEAGRDACARVNAGGEGEKVLFWDQNWRKGGLQERRGQIIREQCFYNQQWCGCEFSHRASENNK